MKFKIIIVSTFLFVACGGDSSSGPAPEKTPDSSVSVPLSSSDDGNSSPVSSSSVANGSEWSCSAEKLVTSSSSTVVSSSSKKASTPANYDAATNTVTDERDGKKYKTVTIGSQTWFAENLAYELADSKGVLGYRCPNNEKDNCKLYGNLYRWQSLLGLLDESVFYPAVPNSKRPYKGICPTGWHIPGLDEWRVLLTNASVNDLLAESAGGTGKSGFNVLLAGGYADGDALFFGKGGMIASLDEYSEQQMRYVLFSSDLVRDASTDTWTYISVRCLMD